MVARLLADKSRNLGMIRLRAVAEVQSEYIYTSGEQASDHILATASRADRSDDFGPSQRGWLR